MLFLLSCSINIRLGGKGGTGGTGGILVLIDTGERLDSAAYFHVNRKVGGLWRGGWVGPAAVVGCSVPSFVHVYSEVMSESGPLKNSGQMGRGFFPRMTLQQSSSGDT